MPRVGRSSAASRFPVPSPTSSPGSRSRSSSLRSGRCSASGSAPAPGSGTRSSRTTPSCRRRGCLPRWRSSRQSDSHFSAWRLSRSGASSLGDRTQSMTRLRIPGIALAVLLLALALVACGEKSEDATGGREGFSLTLDFYPNPDHAGIFMAQKLGYFEEAGLDVGIDTPSDPAAPLKQVAPGRSDLAISYEPEVALAREKGLDVVAVAALVNRPLTSFIWLQKSGIKGVADLKGRTVATAGIPYQDAFLKT